MICKIKIGLALIILSFASTYLSAQSESKLQTKGEHFLGREMYEEALEYFSLRAENTQKENPLYNYYMGMVLYNMSDRKRESTSFLEAYLERATPQQMAYYEHQHVYYMLAKMYHLEYKWDLAEELYSEFIDQVNIATGILPDALEGMLDVANRELDNCRFGRIAVHNPRNVVMEGLGDSINTKYPEYRGVVSQDEKRLIFTSRRPDTKGGQREKEVGYIEDIYSAELEKGSLFEDKKLLGGKNQGSYFNLVTDFNYTNVHRMNDAVNSVKNDRSLQLDQNNDILYFHRDVDIWSIDINEESEKNAVAQKMGLNINSDVYEPSIFFSYDRQKLFIVSDRLGGFGGFDIYVSDKISDEEWSKPRNLGPNVNTPFDEDAPYLDPNGETLYFSSKGHSSMGGYDIFRTKMFDGSCSEAANMGFPVNTPADELYFTMTNRYNRGYYSSNNLEGKGGMDLYRITFSDERDPLAELMGLVMKGGEMVPAKSKITLTLKGTKERISHETDTLVGDYLLLVGHGKTYTMTVETEEFAPYVKEFVVPEQEEYFHLFQEIHHVHLYDKYGNIIGQKITMYNGTDEDSISTQYSSDESMNHMTDIMKNREFKGSIDIKSDVRFYIPKDSIISLMKNDPDMVYDFDENADIFLIKNAFSNRMDPNSYMIVPDDERNELFEILDYLGLDDEEIEDYLDGSKSNYPPDALGSAEVTEIEDLFYTVQIGVYSREVSSIGLRNIQPIYSQRTANKLLNYSSGRFNSYESAKLRKLEIIDLGISDAFVVAYYQGERISMEDAKQLAFEQVND